MAGLITNTSVLLLARRRLERVEKLLRGKVLAGSTVNATERQVLKLARIALKSLNIAPSPTVRFDVNSFTPWLASGISQFAALGAVGPEITKFAAMHAPGQAWLYDTLRSGNPDPQRSSVLNRSSDLLLKFCERMIAALQQQPAGDARDLQLEHLRAYALGYACHLAGAVVSAPYVDAVAFELGSSAEAPPRARLGVPAVRGAIEEAVARRVYNRTNPRGGDWNGWLPLPDAVPGVLFDALNGAAADVYGPGARVPGSKAYNEQLEADDPPALSTDLLRDGYATYRLLTERGYAWTYGDWLLATLPMFVAPALMFPFSGLLPQGKHLRRDDAFFEGRPPDQQRDGERALFELLTFPLAANGLTPLVIMIWLMAGTYLGVGKETIFGLVNALVVLVAAVVFFSTLHVKDMPAWARWLFLFALPLGLEIAHIVYVLKRGGQDKRHWQLAMGSISHIAIALVFVISWVAFLHFGVEGLVDDGLDSGAFWGYAVLWFVIVVVLWLVGSALLNLVDSSLPGVTRADFATARPHYLRLFDHTTLGTGPVATPPATLAHRLYPTERQPLLKLNWTGPGQLFVRPTRDALVFAFAADGSGSTQTVLAPIAPMSAIEFGDLLRKAVQDNAGNFSGQLQVQRFVADEPLDVQLGTGFVFADHGDDQATVEAHATEAAKFRPVPPAGDDAYVLYVAPRDAAAVRIGQSGALLPAGGAAAVNGAGTLNAVVAPGSANVVGDAATRFLDFFVPGDVIQLPAAAPTQLRVVTAVPDDQHLTVNFAFAPAAAGTTYARAARNRDADLTAPPGTVASDQATYRALLGTGTRFERDFMPGDVIRALPPAPASAEERVVVSVQSPTQLTLDAEFSNAIPRAPAAGVPYQRPGRLSAEGFNYTPADPTLLFAGHSVLDRAADLATVWCLAVASRALLPAERAAVTTGAPELQHDALREAQQVFRNWNLDHRRVNEWRQLIGGHAVSEKHGQPDRADVLQPGIPAAYRTPVPAGEPVVNQLGVVPLFIQWLDMAQRSGTDTHSVTSFRPGLPSNQDLSRGVAYLLDLAGPV